LFFPFEAEKKAQEQQKAEEQKSVLKKDFEVLGSSQNSSFSSINGVYSNSINMVISKLGW